MSPPISEGEGQRLFFFTGVNGVRYVYHLINYDMKCGMTRNEMI